jgi:lauroyl/myristoyl acyltransferase
LGLKFATKFLPLLSRKACYRLALLLGSLGASLDRRGRRVALSNLRVAFGDEISSERRAQRSCGNPTIATSCMAECCKTAPSTSTEEIFSPLFNDVVQACRELT